jgi:MoaA/NifB/PqqE/SkfB family radical SAM enzyme
MRQTRSACGNNSAPFAIQIDDRNAAWLVRNRDAQVVAALGRMDAYILALHASHTSDEIRSLAQSAGGVVEKAAESVQHRFGCLLKAGVDVPFPSERLLTVAATPHAPGMRELPGPRVLHWTVTRYCPRKCIYCYAEPLFGGQALDSVISRQELRRIFEEAAQLGAEHFVVSGSEPFLRADLPEIMGDAIECGITPFVTTKHPISPGLAQQLAAAGLRHLSISFDAVSPGLSLEIIGSREYPAQVRASAANLQRAGIRFSIQAVATPQNSGALEEVARFAAELNALVLQIVPFDPVRKSLTEIRNEEMMLPDPDFVEREAERLGRAYPALRVEAFHKSGDGSGYHCDIGMTKLFFLPDGTVHRCYKLAHDDSLRGRNLREVSVAEAWHDPMFHPVLSPPRDRYEGTNCHGCGKFQDCHSEGRCIFDAAANQGGYYAPDRICGGPFPAASDHLVSISSAV